MTKFDVQELLETLEQLAQEASALSRLPENRFDLRGEHHVGRAVGFRQARDVVRAFIATHP